MEEHDDTVAVSREDLDEAVGMLDGLASALAMARRDWDGQATRAAEAVAHIGAELRSEADDTESSEWRQTVIGALDDGLDTSAGPDGTGGVGGSAPELRTRAS